MKIISRINKFIPRKAMAEINAICHNRLISDNNKKADMIREVLERFEVPFTELGPGTNRYAVKIDGFVFKIAMDKNGIDDNRIEAVMSAELQPYVAKTYECNNLMVVSEYVTVISKEEFKENEEVIKGILSQLADSYIFGDVGFLMKNFINWGYRPNGELVILDYGYIYKIQGQEARCTHLLSDDVICGHFLEYDQNFSDLICPHCRTKYKYADIRRRIDLEFEKRHIERSLSEMYKITTAEAIVKGDGDEEEVIEEQPLIRHFYDYEEDEEYYEQGDECMFNPDKTAEILAKGRAALKNRSYDINNNDIECETEYEEDSYEEDDFDITPPPLGDYIYDDDVFILGELMGSPILFTEERYTDIEGLPEGYHAYHVRTTEEDMTWKSIEETVFRNFAGTIITTCELNLPAKVNEDLYTLTYKEITFSDFQKFVDEYENMSEDDDDDDDDFEELSEDEIASMFDDEDEDEYCDEQDKFDNFSRTTIDETDDDTDESEPDYECKYITIRIKVPESCDMYELADDIRESIDDWEDIIEVYHDTSDNNIHATIDMSDEDKAAFNTEAIDKVVEPIINTYCPLMEDDEDTTDVPETLTEAISDDVDVDYDEEDAEDIDEHLEELTEETKDEIPEEEFTTDPEEDEYLNESDDDDISTPCDEARSELANELMSDTDMDDNEEDEEPSSVSVGWMDVSDRNLHEELLAQAAKEEEQEEADRRSKYYKHMKKRY